MSDKDLQKPVVDNTEVIEIPQSQPVKNTIQKLADEGYINVQPVLVDDNSVEEDIQEDEEPDIQDEESAVPTNKRSTKHVINDGVNVLIGGISSLPKMQGYAQNNNTGFIQTFGE